MLPLEEPDNGFHRSQPDLPSKALQYFYLRPTTLKALTLFYAAFPRSHKNKVDQKNAHKGSMLCIVQLGRSINIQRLAFTTISNLINGESSIQLCVDELVSSLGLTIFTIIWNSANGGSSIQLLVDELAKSRLRLSPLNMWLLQLSFQNLYAPWHQVQELLMKVSLRTLTLELNDFHQSKPLQSLQYFYLRPTTHQALL